MGIEPVEHSERENLQLREGCTVEALIERHQTIAIESCMRTDKAVGKDPARQFLFAPLASPHIALKCPARHTPDLLARFPVDANPSGVEERIEHLLRAFRQRQQLRINSPGDSKRTSFLR